MLLAVENVPEQFVADFNRNAGKYSEIEQVKLNIEIRQMCI